MKDKNLNDSNFNPIQNVDTSFEYTYSELSKRLIKNIEGKSIGRVINHQYNMGIGLFDINKLENLVHRIDDPDDQDLWILIWKPEWINRFLPTKSSSDKSLSINPKEQFTRYQDSRQYYDQQEYERVLKDRLQKEEK